MPQINCPTPLSDGFLRVRPKPITRPIRRRVVVALPTSTCFLSLETELQRPFPWFPEYIATPSALGPLHTFPPPPFCPERCLCTSCPLLNGVSPSSTPVNHHFRKPFLTPRTRLGNPPWSLMELYPAAYHKPRWLFSVCLCDRFMTMLPLEYQSHEGRDCGDFCSPSNTQGLTLCLAFGQNSINMHWMNRSTKETHKTHTHLFSLFLLNLNSGFSQETSANQLSIVFLLIHSKNFNFPQAAS